MYVVSFIVRSGFIRNVSIYIYIIYVYTYFCFMHIHTCMPCANLGSLEPRDI